MPWNDNDFVYFDADTRTVIGPVEWSKMGNAKPLQKPERAAPAEAEGGKGGRRWHQRKEFYIWGSYKSLKRLYNLEGKHKDAERTQTLDEAMAKAMQEAYWN